MTTLTAAVLDALLAKDPAGPRITYYDDASGERIELSTVTLANWAAKTGNLLRDELGAGPGTRVAVLLPAHWQTAAVLFGVWWIGAEVVMGASGREEPSSADIALCTAARLDEADAAVTGGEVAVLSLDPFGKPADGLPIGVTDYATSVRVHGDQIVPERQPGAALDGRSVADVLAAAHTSAATQGITATDRVLSTASWDSPDDIVDHLVAVFATGASLVQVANPDPAAMDRHRITEKVTRG
ncbi:TIGR03089 family protein [Mycobacterium sp. 21AC1]|uniref:TIGR03089 family protein n=1 Tax=[Mycobacterium] appelbergii TaxID=2939269 RepID=UPI0029392FAE|nr:TIGR03089 family protein [Mycobacterium sp. 21AC1]MDV3126881.1 TIGR03089 family protein [Mycobacterium sp. 21AC1]